MRLVENLFRHLRVKFFHAVAANAMGYSFGRRHNYYCPVIPIDADTVAQTANNRRAAPCAYSEVRNRTAEFTTPEDLNLILGFTDEIKRFVSPESLGYLIHKIPPIKQYTMFFKKCQDILFLFFQQARPSLSMARTPQQFSLKSIHDPHDRTKVFPLSTSRLQNSWQKSISILSLRLSQK